MSVAEGFEERFLLPEPPSVEVAAVVAGGPRGSGTRRGVYGSLDRNEQMELLRNDSALFSLSEPRLMHAPYFIHLLISLSILHFFLIDIFPGSTCWTSAVATHLLTTS